MQEHRLAVESTQAAAMLGWISLDAEWNKLEPSDVSNENGDQEIKKQS